MALIHPQSRSAAGWPRRRRVARVTGAESALTAAPAPEAFGSAPRRFTAAEYFRLAETGVLAPAERVELIGGTIYEMAPQGDAHLAQTIALDRFFQRLDFAAEPARWLVSCQSTLRFGQRAVPDPDLALLRPRADFYRRGGMKPADVYLIVEVAVSSLPKDRTLKAADYARAGIQDYWIVNVPEARVEVHRRPVRRSGRYREVRAAAAGETLALVAFPEVSVAVADLLAPLLLAAPTPAPRQAAGRRRPPAAGQP